MNTEKERRFLVKPLDGIVFIPDTRQDIIQMYLEDEETHSVRIRIINDSQAFFCYKKYIEADTKKEFEFPIDIDAALDILHTGEFLTILRKTRFKIDGWDVDKYNDNLIIAEFEFSDENPLPEILPEWIGEEVTGVYKYSNVALAQNSSNFINYKDGRNCDCLQPGCPYCDSDGAKKKLKEIEKLLDNKIELAVQPLKPEDSLWTSFWGMVWLGCKEIFKYER